tara:strand:- start:624 stop:2042 length:1419 start_codon:yes stop_codon:yes gene_type:complete
MPIFTVGAAGTTSTASHDVPYGIMFGENTRQSKTFSGAGNRKTFTLSMWVKLSKISTGTQYFYGGANAGNNYALLRYENYNFEWIAYNSGSQFAYLRTTALFRDPNAWYHIVIASDTTQSTAANRTKMYVNGVQVTNFQTENYPAQDGSYVYNNNLIHTLGAFYDGSSYGGPFEGYMCEVVSIDGQQLEPTSFGEFDTASGIWKPKDPSDLTFGTNGFYLNFATRATDAIDASGQGNNFASDNVASTDWSLDTCTNNYCTLNPLFRNQARTNTPTYANGNTEGKDNSDCMTEGSMLVYGGKWYYEVYTSGDTMFGWGQAGRWPGDAPGQSYSDTKTGWGLHANGKILYGGSYITSTSESWSTGGDTIMIAIDFDNQKVYHGKNGNWAHSMNPAGNSGGEGLDSTFWDGVRHGWVPAFRISNGGSDYSRMNFGNPLRSISSSQADDNGHGNFEYDVPAGFYALNTKNLAEHGG